MLVCWCGNILAVSDNIAGCDDLQSEPGVGQLERNKPIPSLARIIQFSNVLIHPEVRIPATRVPFTPMLSKWLRSKVCGASIPMSACLPPATVKWLNWIWEEVFGSDMMAEPFGKCEPTTITL